MKSHAMVEPMVRIVIESIEKIVNQIIDSIRFNKHKMRVLSWWENCGPGSEPRRGP